MTLRGNGNNYGARIGTYYNPLQVYPRVKGASAISADNSGEQNPSATIFSPANGNTIFTLMMAAGPSSDAVFTPPSGEGWVSVASAYDPTSADTRAELFYKLWGDGFVDNTDPVFNSSAPNARVAIVTVENSSLIVAPTAAAQPGSTNVQSNTPIAPSVEVPVNGLLLHFYQVAGSASSVTADSSALFGGAGYLGTAGTDIAVAADSMVMISGSSPAAMATASTPTVANGWNTLSLGLRGVTSTPVITEFSTISSDTNSPNASKTLASTPNAGDYVLAILVNAGASAPGYTPPTGEGFSLVDSSHSTSGLDSSITLYIKEWGQGFTDNTTIAFTGALGNTRLVLLVIAGAVSGTPYVASGVATQSDSSGDSMSITAPSIVVPYDAALVLRFFAASNNLTSIDVTPPMNEIFGGASYGFVNGTNGAMAASAQVRARAGTANARTASTSSPTASGNVGITAIVAPIA